MVEGIRNAFSFTVSLVSARVPAQQFDPMLTLGFFHSQDPFKSSILFAAIALVWLFLAVIPTRYIILCAGLVRLFEFGSDVFLLVRELSLHICLCRRNIRPLSCPSTGTCFVGFGRNRRIFRRMNKTSERVLLFQTVMKRSPTPLLLGF